MCWRTACSTLPCKDFVQKVDIFRDNFSVYSKSIFGENRCWRAAFLQWVADRPPGGRAHQHSAHCSAKEGYSSSAQERYHALQCRGGIPCTAVQYDTEKLHFRIAHQHRGGIPTVCSAVQRRDTLMHCKEGIQCTAQGRNTDCALQWLLYTVCTGEIL